MFSRLRRLKNSNIPLRVRGASNPPDDGSGEWVYNRFVNPKTKDKKAIFLPAGMDDNPFLDKEAYIEALENLDPVTRTRLRDGVWTIVRKGNMFKREWFEFVDIIPRNRQIVRFWDCAATEVDPRKKRRGQRPDWTVGFKLSRVNDIYYIEDIVHIQKSAMHVEEIQKQTAQVDGHTVLIREEEEGGSSGKYVIQKKKTEVFPFFDYKGVRSTGSKIDRAQMVSAASERGQIKIVRGCRNIEAFFDELETFPDGPHDDLVDGFSGAFNALGIQPVTAVPQSIEFDENKSPWEVCETIINPGSYWKRRGI